MSYTDLNYHIVYAVKERRPLLHEDVLPQLVKYTGGIIRQLGGKMFEANGPENHFHIMASIPPTISISDFLRDVKAGTSGWVHQTFSQYQDFGWQDGYSAFTVSHSNIPKVSAYIRNQQEHHTKMTFEEELIELLKRHGVQFDERNLHV